MNRKKNDMESGDSQPPTKRKRGRFILILSVIVLVGLGAGVFALLNMDNPFGLLPAPTSPFSGEGGEETGTFYEGVYVDDISLAGLTPQEAKVAVEAQQQEYVLNNGVTVRKKEKSWQYKIADVKYQYDTDTVLEQAWRLGREGTWMQRNAAIQQLRENPVRLTTSLAIDPSGLESTIRALAAPYTREPVDAMFKGYDAEKPQDERLSFAADVPGERVDADVLWASVRKEFENRTFGTVQMAVVPIQANVQLDALKARTQLVVRWRSQIRDHSAPRLTNIRLANAAISGRILQPGEQLSFNDTTGERTAEKGYQVAHVINGGVTDNGLGGGICQVSGTLWNAAVRADMAIVERLNHTLKSSYMKPGEDATVDFGHKDLKIQNNKPEPVLLILYIAKEKGKYYLYSEIYGVPLEDGVSIDLESVRTKVVPAPSGEPRYVASEAVKIGTTETNQPRQGEYYTTYKIYFKDGKEVRRVEQHTSYYPASVLTIVFNPADGIPTPTPSATPTPSPTPVWPAEPEPTATLE